MCLNDRTKTLRQVGPPLQSSLTREKGKKGDNSHKAGIGTLSCGHSSLIYKHFICGFFIKTNIIMYISTKIHRPYVCDPLGLYISLVNNFIDQITPYWSILINYPHQHLDELIKDQFNPIDRLSCQPIGCQATPRRYKVY